MCALSLCGVLQNKVLSGGGMEDSVIDLQVNVSIDFSKTFFKSLNEGSRFVCLFEQK